MRWIWHRIVGVWLWLVACPAPSAANWLYLSVASLASSRVDTGDTCMAVPGLAAQQLDVCRRNPDAMFCVGQGARRGLYQCQYQFRNERWNCTATNQTMFEPLLQRGTRETAFIYAVTSAGVVHAVTQSCSAGNLTDCSCDLSHKKEPPSRNTPEGEVWTWGGCSDDVSFGISFCRDFVDASDKAKQTPVQPESKRVNIRALVNLHNNEVGRRVVQQLMHKKCRCHGVSGSCAVRTCWMTMPNFQAVGASLKQRYERAVAVAPRSKRKLRRKLKHMRRTPISPDEIVYMDRSPNYCRRNLGKGVPGTRGRTCNRDSSAPGSCNLLCCGRGYNTQVVRHVERCYCKFYWCCKVKCKLCETMLDRYTCK